MTALGSLIIFLLVLTVLVLIHELGHFITARLFHIKVEEFGIGYPPRVLTLFHFKKIPFTLNAIPVGGFVRMLGEDESQAINHTTTQKDSIQKSRKEYAFYERSKIERLVVILAGATVNFLFGIVAFTIIFSRIGIPKIATHPTVVEVNVGSPAKTAGIQPGDEVISASFVGQAPVGMKTTDDLVRWIVDHEGKQISLIILRKDGKHTITASVRKPEAIPANQGALGIVLEQNVAYVFYPWYQMPFRATYTGITQSLDFGKAILSALGSIGHDVIVKKTIPQGVAGPIGIAHEVTKQKIFDEGPLAVLNFMALLSINLSIMNVLPIPALDGGRAFFIFLEVFIGKKRRAAIEGRVNQYGMVFLLLLILVISFNDVLGIVRK